MGAGTGVALKTLQWFLRGVQLCCAALILSIYSYFLATLQNHGFHISNEIRAVEGISGFATLYSLIGVLVLCCVAGHKFFSFFAIVLDVCFAAAFIYVATVNREGAGSCDGQVTTAFGTGDADTNVTPSGDRGFTALPSFRTACKLESACLAVAIVAIFFYIFSALTEVALGRHRHKERRFGPGPRNDYTSGYGKRKGLLGFLPLRRSGTTKSHDPNALPEHTHPDQVRNSYATENSSDAAVGAAGAGAVGAYPRGSSEAINAPLPAQYHSYGNDSSNSSYKNGGYRNKYSDFGNDIPYLTSHNPPMATVKNPYDNNGSLSSAHGTNPEPYPGSDSQAGQPPARYPPANYRYSDGVYDA